MHGGEEYRVAMNIWDVAFDDELAYLVVQGGAFAIPRRGPLTGEDSETTEILSADVAQIEVDDVYVYTIEDARKRRRGFSLVKRPKKGGAPVGIAASERSARTFTLRDGIAVFAVEGGPITTLRVDGGDAPRAVDATDGVETFAIDGGFLFWVSVRAPAIAS